ncbi:MinD/ParA family protein [Pseudonocardia sp. 73-21]|uniref:MinD/ParA family ATP-binding protein n=1 Tax=Pseudonocardia sp. 73-21 TaxID=1895809 RepID=UPI000960091C|nr:MinD/ParA family protein [Pseudonocardia sp. 73-21]OJY47218.1 MAG: hypothetical protein BGP03_29500 [Pseudonocardia sp. 73-21]
MSSRESDAQDRTDAGDEGGAGAWSTEGRTSTAEAPTTGHGRSGDDGDGRGHPDGSPGGEEPAAAPDAGDDTVEMATVGQSSASTAEPVPTDAPAADDDSIEDPTTDVLARPQAAAPMAQQPLPQPPVPQPPVPQPPVPQPPVPQPPMAPPVPYLAGGAVPGNGCGPYGPPAGHPAGPPPRYAQRTQPRPRPDASSAAELTEDAIVRFRSDRPRTGWRGAVFKASGGMVNPGIGPAEKARQERLRRIRRPLPGSHQIAVASIKGGVGKTSVTACLGLVLAENRGDRVIALDANPDAGTLADRLTTETTVTVRNLIDNIEATHSLTDVARYTSLAGRLQVLASEQDPAMSEAFNRDEYERVSKVLTRFYNIVITDSGTGLVHSAMEGTLALADSLVVVGAPTVDGASRASKTLDWLIAHGHAARVADAVVVLSCDRTSKDVDRARVRNHFEARCRAVVEIPHDPHLATGGRIQLDRLRPPTVDAFLTLAALLADGFAGPVRTAGTPADGVPSLS